MSGTWNMICRLILVKIYNSMSLSVLFVYTFIISDQYLLKNHYNGWLWFGTRWTMMILKLKLNNIVGIRQKGRITIRSSLNICWKHNFCIKNKLFLAIMHQNNTMYFQPAFCCWLRVLVEYLLFFRHMLCKKHFTPFRCLNYFYTSHLAYPQL